MTIICPACDARFRSPPAEIPLDRPVQCGKCDHEWVRKPISVNPTVELDGPSVLAADKTDSEAQKDALIKTDLEIVMPQDTDTEVDTRLPLYVDRLPETKPKTPSALLPMIGMTCVALFAGSIIFKDAVMNEVPQTVAYYQKAGLAPDNRGLAITNVVTRKTNTDGIRQLIVRGEVQNIADATVPVPALKLIMRGQKNADLYNWKVTTSKNELKAGETSRFTAVAYNFPDEAVNVEVEFIPLDKESKAE